MLSPPDQWRGRAVLSFAVKPDGSAWIGTEGGGLYRYEGGQWTAFDESRGIVNLFVWSVLARQRGDLLVGTWGGGLLAMQGDRFEPFGGLTSKGAAVTALFEDSHGDLWVGTTTGLHKYTGQELTWSAGKEKLVLPDVRAVTEAPDRAIWFGMLGGGLGFLKDGALKQFRKQDGLGSDFVQCLLADKDGTLWIGTSDNGLVRWRKGKFASIAARQGLPSRSLSHLVDDGAGNLWMGSHNGILRATKVDLNRCAEGQSPSVRCLHFGKAEGLASPTCSGGFQPGACQTPNGLLCFPTIKGLAIIDPVNVTRNRVKPRVAIEELLADGQTLDLSANLQSPGPIPIVISPGRQRVEFRYTALSFTAPDKVLFRYKLKGLEPGWVQAGTERSAHYSYLPPGRYTFCVIACNNDEVWNETGASLDLMIQPWFWQTWWFQLAALLSGAGVVGASARAVTRRRVRARLQQMERQQAVERERARIARDIHDDLGASLTRISMLSQGVRAEVEGQTQAAADADQIFGTARELTRAMDEIVWAVNPTHDSLDSLVTYLGRFAQTFLSAAGIRCRLDEPFHLPTWSLTAEVRHNVFLAFKEALHNVVKHAHASEVGVSFELWPSGFVLLVTDNGTGFDLHGHDAPPAELSTLNPLARHSAATAAQPSSFHRLAAGNGLLNMRKRLEEVGGSCQWDSAPGEGTRVRFVINVKR